jgi:ADP-ribose pyrophosphatase YjhB (NUDIX family)/N-acetylglutamate synthase-like GNAT family acetyltransferase
MEVRYCPKCATELVLRWTGDRERPVCPGCGFVFYFNPVVGAGALVETEGRVVLVRRGVEPKAGYWSLPSGYVEADELAEAAAVRETQEETGLEIEIEDLLGVYSFGREPQTGVLILYSAHTVGGKLQAGDDAQEVGTFAPHEIPPDEQIAFRTHLRALQDWRRARAIVYRQATMEDKQAVIELGKRHREVEETCADYTNRKNRGLLLAWDREYLVGLACVSHRPWRHATNIDQVFVRPGYRRWGIATQLVSQAIAYAREQQFRTVLAEAPVTNPVLLVYLKAGFRVSGFIDAYYPPGRDGPVTALFLAYDLA